MTAPTRPVSTIDRLAQLACLLADPDLDVAGTDQLLVAALALLCDIVPGARWASLTHRKAQPRTTAASDPRAAALDELQYRAGDGPCLTALSSAGAVVSNFAVERRWPAFTAAALTDGLATGSVSYPLAAVGHPATSLNLYTDLDGAGDRIDRQVGEVAVPLLAIALTAVNQRHTLHHLEIGLATSRSIGAAVGVLMSRHQWTYEQAFEALRAASQHGHRRLRDIASDVVLIGELPE